jgi:Holliday junction resolvase-like predicted endonuclease
MERGITNNGKLGRGKSNSISNLNRGLVDQMGKTIGKTNSFLVDKDLRSSGTYFIIFLNPIEEESAKKKLFVDGIIPSGIAFEKQIYPSNTWKLRYLFKKDDLSTQVSTLRYLNSELLQILSSDANVLSLTEEQSDANRKRYDAALNSKVPFSNATFKEVLNNYKDGVYELNGYTFFIGFDRAYQGKVISIIRDSDYKETEFSRAYLRDIKYYLANGYTMTEAKQLTEELWLEMNFKILGNFALTLAGASISKSTFHGEGGSNIIDIAARSYDMYTSLKEAKQFFLGEREDEEYTSLNSEVITKLRDLNTQIGNSVFIKDLNTGQLGEAIVKKTLELRGYEVFQIQNASGNGIDLIALKVNSSGEHKILYYEVKSSKSNNFKLSEAQKNPVEFVKSRLKMMAERTGRYAKLSITSSEVAQICLDEINRTGAVKSIKVTVHDLESPNKGVKFHLEFRRWIPKAIVNKKIGKK